MTFYLLYPERRSITDEQLRQWYTDAVADSLIEPPYTEDLMGMAKALEDIGHITLHITVLTAGEDNV